METLATDWAHGKIDVVVQSTDKHLVFHSLDEFLDCLSEPSRIIIESSFESFFRDTKRNDFIDRCEREGHDLKTVPPRATGRWKLKVYPREQYPQYYKNNAKFPDELACRLFLRMESAGVHLSKPRKFYPDDEKIKIREAANHDLMLMRNTKRMVVGPRGGVKHVSAKNDYADMLIEKLPPYESLTEIQQIALGNGKEYSKVIIAAAGVASYYANSKKEFVRLTGLYHHAYPSQIRSDIHFHGWWKTPRNNPKQDQIMLKDYSRSVKWIFKQLRNADTLTDPANVL